MRRTWMGGLAACAAALLLGCGGDDDPGPGPGASGAPQLTVMTRNLFLGTGFDVLADPATALNPPAAVRRLFAEVQDTDPPARMARVADEIAARRPDVVALQEAAIFRTLTVPAVTETVAWDFVALVVDALRGRGLEYRVVAVTTNFDERLPDDTGRLVRFTDRDVLLARSDVATTEPEDRRFTARVSASLDPITLAIPRGLCAVTVDVGGTPVRVVNTHLEAISAPVREAQARELVALLAAEARPAVLTGDFNSPPDEATGAYGILRGGGWSDAWEPLRPGDPGLTCCFQPDLRTPDPLENRIDLVLFRGGLVPASSEVVGEEPGDRTASGLWPSDHAGVFTTLRTR